MEMCKHKGGQEDEASMKQKKKSVGLGRQEMNWVKNSGLILRETQYSTCPTPGRHLNTPSTHTTTLSHDISVLYCTIQYTLHRVSGIEEQEIDWAKNLDVIFSKTHALCLKLLEAAALTTMHFNSENDNTIYIHTYTHTTLRYS